MTPTTFEAQCRAAAGRVSELRDRAERASTDERGEILKEGLEELGVAFEELHVAQEELRAQNEALEESRVVLGAERDRYRELFEFAPVAYVVTDSEGVIRQGNQAAGELLQIAPRYLRGKPLTVFVEPEDRPTFLADLSAVPKGEPMPIRVLRMRPRPEDSESRMTTVAVVSFKDPETRATFLRWQFVDTTDQWRAAEELRLLNQDLETRVRTRTERLERTVREKEAAERELASASRRKDEFMAVLGHELRGPLAAIRNAAELIRAYLPGDSNVQPSVGVIERQSRRMTRLMDDLLDVARIAQGKVQVRPTTIDVVDVVRAAVEGIRPLVGGLELKTVLPDNSVVVRADPDRLDQILLNLLTNAVKFTSSGSVSVTVEASNDVALVRVQDTGVGIAPAALPRIFDLFVQSSHSTDRSQGGLGIGLHLVKRLVELHGGTIEANSEGHDKGSEFVVRLPVETGTTR